MPIWGVPTRARRSPDGPAHSRPAARRSPVNAIERAHAARAGARTPRQLPLLTCGSTAARCRTPSACFCGARAQPAAPRRPVQRLHDRPRRASQRLPALVERSAPNLPDGTPLVWVGRYLGVDVQAATRVLFRSRRPESGLCVRASAVPGPPFTTSTAGPPSNASLVLVEELKETRPGRGRRRTGEPALPRAQ